MKMVISRAACLTMLLALGAAAEPAPIPQKTFASPDAAVAALRGALAVHDVAAQREIFGPDFHSLLTGDAAQDKANSQKFAKAIETKSRLVPDGDARFVLEIGDDNWPFPIPLVKENSAWRFDTEAGKQEIVDRHVGKDELHAIGVCEAYVPAQKKYVTGGRGASGAVRYARKFVSAPGQRDGLYWETKGSEERSPFDSKIAAAGIDGNPAPKPFHGYFFKILTGQGPHAPGGKTDYVKDDVLVGGFGLVAYPERYGKSGIMTFIVNQDGKIYQRDLGKTTVRVASHLNEFDPSSDWTLVKDPGVLEK